MKKAILPFFCLLFFSVLNAQSIVPGEWEKISNIEGSFIYELEMRGKNIYARTPTGFFISEDDGYNWSKFEHDLDLNVAFNGTIFYNSNRLDSDSINYNIFRYSIDNGRSWIEKEFKDSIVNSSILPLHSGEWLRTSIAIHPNTSSSWQYASYYLSADEGETWTFQSRVNTSYPSPSGARVIEISPGIFFRPKKYSSGPFLSNDMAQSWFYSQVRYDHNDSQVPQFKTLENGDIWAMGDIGAGRSQDRGLTWERIASPAVGSTLSHDTHLPSNSGVILSQGFNLDNEDPSRSRVTYKSIDGGNTWDKVNFPIDVTIQPIELENGDIIGNTYDLLRSKDGGETWEFTGQGLNQSPISDLQPITKDTLLLKTGFRFLRSYDAGRNWETILIDSARHYYVWGDRISKRVENKIIIATQEKVFLTKDLGTSFKNITPPEHGSSYTSTALISRISPQGDLFISSLIGTYVSHDEGENWFFSDSSYFDKIRFSDDGTWVAQAPGSYPNYGKRSIDKGRTWEDIPFFGYGNAFDFDREGNLLFYKNSQLILSEDSGSTGISLGKWEFGDNNYNDFFIDENNLIVSGSTEFTYLGNTSNSEYLIFPPLDSLDLVHPKWFDYYSIYVSEDNYLFLIGEAGELFRFSRPISDFSDLSSASEISANQNFIKVFPNPTQGDFIMELPEKLGNEANLLVFNNLGEIVLKRQLSKNQKEFRINDVQLPTGIYYFLIREGKVSLNTGKLVVE